MVPNELQFLSICYFHIHFHFTPTDEVNVMYERIEEMVPKIAIFYHNTSKLKLLKQNS